VTLTVTFMQRNLYDLFWDKLFPWSWLELAGMRMKQFFNCQTLVVLWQKNKKSY